MTSFLGSRGRSELAACAVAVGLSSIACSTWEQLWKPEPASSRSEHEAKEANEANEANDGASSVSTSKGGGPKAAPKIDTSGWTREKFFAYFNQLRGDAYPLDVLPRHLETPESEVPCLAEQQQVYRGTQVKFVPLSVHPAFVERLKRLELLFAEEAEAFYGRAPRTVLHAGGYACRKSRFASKRISEHAFGNAIDITGFSFGPLPKETADGLSAEVPRGSFQVRILTHWTSKGGPTGDLHQEFLRSLAARIVSEGAIRVALGPSHRGHQSHLHLDMSPWRYTDL